MSGEKLPAIAMVWLSGCATGAWLQPNHSLVVAASMAAAAWLLAAARHGRRAAERAEP